MDVLLTPCRDRKAVKAAGGPLRGTRTVDQVTGREVVTLAGDQGRSIDIRWPDLSKDSVDVAVKAIVDAAALGAWARANGKPVVVLGRDARTSGPMFARAATAGLMSVGVEVIDVGVAPTPTVQLAVEHHHAGAGLILTASHNPAASTTKKTTRILVMNLPISM